jgi:signal recognition particle receptor subunit beta
MALIDIRKREIHAKIVYYGPSLSGKTTNLLNIHSRLPDDLKGGMQSIATEDERTLFFDFIPIEEVVLGGWAVRFHLYSVPGQDVYVRTRRAILGGSDGIVFVADAAEERLGANRSSLTELEGHLRHYRRTASDLPIVFQYNKIDVEDALPAEVLEEELNPGSLPAFPAIAIHGNGVAETLGAISRLVARTL